MFGLEEAEGGSVRVDWLGHSEVSAKDILATPQDREHADARSEAVEFLMEVLADGPVGASRVKEEAEDAGISERTLARAKKTLGVMSYREGETGGRGKGQWLWKLPVVDLVDDDIKGAREPIKDANSSLNKNGGILNHRGGAAKGESPIDKADSLRMPTVKQEPAKNVNLIKDASVPTVGEPGTPKRCIHNHPDGKGCYLCDPSHPHRLKEGAKA